MAMRRWWKTKAGYRRVLLALFATSMLLADDDPDAVVVPAQVSVDEIAQLRQQLAIQQQQIAAQQKQIDYLLVTLDAQQKEVGQAPGSSTNDKQTVVSPAFEKLGDVASTTPVVPVDGGAASSQHARPVPPPSNDAPAPLYFKIGETYITPVGFLDLTYVGRSTNVGSGIGTNFASIPFNNVPQGRLTDGFLSLQNSRIGARFDTNVRGIKVLAWWESDFLGNQPTNILVSTNSDTFRIRLFWVDLKKDTWEFLGGQSWSLLTPGRKGISPLPSDVFFSYDIDTNYQVGTPWARIPTARAVWHPRQDIAWALAAENAQQYIGGSAGGGLVTLPAALVTVLNNQLDNGTNSFAVPTLHPDIISKVAFDPVVKDHLLHVEVAGILRSFRIFNSLNERHFRTVGGGGSLNSNLELISKGRLRLVENFFYGRGVGRWLFGQGPDLIVNSNGALGLLQASGASGGFEVRPFSSNTNKLLLYTYYGADYFGRGVAIDTNGKPVGYGYPGSPNTNNRTAQEATAGFGYTFWENPKWGSLQFFGQYSYLFRVPWFVALGQPSRAHTNMSFVDLRYLFPGQTPVR
jgi:hypothetical protein